jgi:protein-S-isoprenylcysteine O-methyltransferase Ste14
MFSMTDVMIDALWILALAGVFATFSYTDWLRSEQKARWRTQWALPRFLVPLNLSLTAFCIGVALSGATSYAPDPWWQTVIWAVLAILFGVQTYTAWRFAVANGWEMPVEDKSKAADIGEKEDANFAEMY